MTRSDDGPSATMGSLINEQRKGKNIAVHVSELTASVVRGKTVLVTGSNTGLGLEAARHYYRLGAGRLILGVRSLHKGEEAKRNIEANPIHPDTAGTNRTAAVAEEVNPRPIVSVWNVDMCSFASIRAFAARIATELGTLDIALLNAGLSKDVVNLTNDGWDESLQVNAIGTLLLAALLLPTLRASAQPAAGWKPRLSVVVSRLAETIDPRPHSGDWQAAARPLVALNADGATKGIGSRYAATKYVLMAGWLELVARARHDIICICSDPGPTTSGLGREGQQKLVLRLAGHVFAALVSRTPEVGSRTLVRATLLSEKDNGRWLDRTELKDFTKNLTGPAGSKLVKKIWVEIVEVLRANGVSDDILLS